VGRLSEAAWYSNTEGGGFTPPPLFSPELLFHRERYTLKVRSMKGIKLLVSLIFLLPLMATPQKNAPASQPRPTPKFTGRLLTIDGTRRLILQAKHNLKSVTFTGDVQSTCMLPAHSKPGESRPLDLSSIPIGTLMTAFYVRHRPKGGQVKPAENVVLAIRFDELHGHDSALPRGVAIPCFKSDAQTKK